MTPLQRLLQAIDSMIFQNAIANQSLDGNDSLIMLRAMVELMLKEEHEFIQNTYYQGRRDQVFKESDFIDYMEKLNQQPW